MTRVFYMVGANGLETRCNTLAVAQEMASNSPAFKIRTCYELVEEPSQPLSEKRIAWLKAHTK